MTMQMRERRQRWKCGLLLCALFRCAPSFADSPINDNLVNALPVVGSFLQLEADLADATREPLETLPTGHLGHTAWWHWVAPADGICVWDATQSTSPVSVTVFEEDAFGQLTQTTSASHHAAKTASGWVLLPYPQGSFQTKQGSSYWIQLDLAYTQSLGWIVLPPIPLSPSPVKVGFTLATPSPQQNDDFAARASLSGVATIFTAQLWGATAETAEPTASHGALHRSLWWSWTAPGYGKATIQCLSTTNPPLVGAYARGALQNLQLVGSSATELGNDCYQEPASRSWTTWRTSPGVPYEIQVDCLPNYDFAPSTLSLNFTPALENDVPVGAILLNGLETSVVASNTVATLRPDEPVIPTQSGANSVWYRWTAPTGGILQVTNDVPARFDDPTFEPGGTTGVIIIHPGFPCSEDLTDIHPAPLFVPVFGLFPSAASNSAVPASSCLSYGTNGLMTEVTSGNNYWVALDGAYDSIGQTNLNLLLIPPPSNDSFSNRVVLPSEAGRVRGRTFAATAEAHDPDYTANGMRLNRSVWWEWHAPSAGRWTLFIVRGSWDNQFSLYRGAVANATAEIQNTQREPIVFECAQGETFIIGAFARVPFGGSVEFTLTPVVSPGLRWVSYLPDLIPGTAYIRLQLPDNSGLPYVLESSADLTLWSALATNANAWSHTLDLMRPSGQPMEFFRARLQSP